MKGRISLFVGVGAFTHPQREKILAKQNISVCIADCKTYKLNEKSQMLLYAIRRLEGIGVSEAQRLLHQFFIWCHQKLGIIWKPSGTTLMRVPVCVFLGEKTPIIRRCVTIEAVACQGMSCYLSVTASLFSVCRWLGMVSLNTHICCSSMAWTTERSAIKMTLIVNLKKDALEAFYPRARRPETRS